MREASLFSGVPPVGGFAVTDKNSKLKVKPQVRYIIGDVADPQFVAMLEMIMTKSLNVRDNKAPMTVIGDIMVLREDTHFTKDGDYIAAVKYVEMVAADTKTPHMDRLSSDDTNKDTTKDFK